MLGCCNWIARIMFGCVLVLSYMPASVASSLTPSVGLNKFDLFKQYLGVASGGDGSAAYQRVTQGMAKKAIADARDIGVSFFRISATGYAPSVYDKSGDLDLWLRDPLAYWKLFDQMMDDLHAQNMRAVLTLVWHSAQFPAMTGETIPVMMRNPDSKSYILLSKYVTEFVTRYRSHPALMFYELTNEMNLSADLDSAGRCRKSQPLPLCEPIDNYSTADVITFTTRLAELVRKLDTTHPISSGFSIPRVNAEGLRENPEWSAGELARLDTREQFDKYLSDINRAVDIISVHLYGTPDNRRFGSSDEVDLLAEVKRAADNIGKPLFVGEIGDPQALTASPGSFSERLLNKIVELRIPYSAMWTWEFYQQNPYSTYDSAADSFSLEPGYTDYMIERLKQTNSDLGNLAIPPQGDDKNPPNVVLTWPLECAQLKETQNLYAVASDDRGKVKRVAFWLDGKKMGEAISPPYKFELNTKNLEKGNHDIVTRAVDMADNISEWKTAVLIGQPKSGGICASAAR